LVPAAEAVAVTKAAKVFLVVIQLSQDKRPLSVVVAVLTELLV
jgi:hypothetical protein